MVTLLDDALRRGLRLYFDQDGTLQVAGPRAAEKTARAVTEHRALLSWWLRDGRVLLDWHARPVLHHTSGCVLCCDVRDDKGRHPSGCFNCGPSWNRRRPDLCRWCQRTAHFHDDDQAPAHKTCTEAQIWRRLVELRDRRAAA